MQIQITFHTGWQPSDCNVKTKKIKFPPEVNEKLQKLKERQSPTWDLECFLVNEIFSREF